MDHGLPKNIRCKKVRNIYHDITNCHFHILFIKRFSKKCSSKCDIQNVPESEIYQHTMSSSLEKERDDNLLKHIALDK